MLNVCPGEIVMIININQLRAFYYAARLRSITLAAQELMVTPPAISMQVKQLEQNLDIKLMFRDRNSIRITELGKVFLEKCDKIFKEINKLEKTEYESKMFSDYEDRFQYFLAVSLLFMIIEFFIYEKKSMFMMKIKLFDR